MISLDWIWIWNLTFVPREYVHIQTHLCRPSGNATVRKCISRHEPAVLQECTVIRVSCWMSPWPMCRCSERTPLQRLPNGHDIPMAIHHRYTRMISYKSQSEIEQQPCRCFTFLNRLSVIIWKIQNQNQFLMDNLTGCHLSNVWVTAHTINFAEMVVWKIENNPRKRSHDKTITFLISI